MHINNVRTKVMKVLKCMLLVCVVFSLSSCKTFKKKRMFSNNVDTLLTQTVVASDPVVVEDTTPIKTVVEETEPVEINNEPGTGYTADKYYMVVGSFLSEQLAQKYARKIMDEGYQTLVIQSPSTGYYRVTANSYTDFQTAIGDISTYRNDVSGNAWVHVKR